MFYTVCVRVCEYIIYVRMCVRVCVLCSTVKVTVPARVSAGGQLTPPPLPE